MLRGIPSRFGSGTSENKDTLSDKQKNLFTREISHEKALSSSWIKRTTINNRF